jgi:hypothetical protein
MSARRTEPLWRSRPGRGEKRVVEGYRWPNPHHPWGLQRWEWIGYALGRPDVSRSHTAQVAWRRCGGCGRTDNDRNDLEELGFGQLLCQYCAHTYLLIRRNPAHPAHAHPLRYVARWRPPPLDIVLPLP